jgi:hypothetical protein
MGRFRKSSISRDEYYQGRHRFEHWYRDNQVYFITARCRARFPAFASEAAKLVFWDRFDQHTSRFGFVPWVTTLLDNHYHTLGYLKRGEDLGPMMRNIHGSVAKLVNDLLNERLTPFWYDSGKQGYFDGCIRDVLQATRAYRYTLKQSVRHGIERDWRRYRHTRVNVEMDRAIHRAVEINAFMEGVPYARYEKHRRVHPCRSVRPGD